jgi:hypothetical protein
MAFLFYNRPLFFMASLLRRTLVQLVRKSARRLLVGENFSDFPTPSLQTCIQLYKCATQGCLIAAHLLGTRI